MGWVHACQKGTAKKCPDKIKKVANSISYGDAEDFAKTKHKGLPEMKRLKSFAEFRENQLTQADRGMASIMTGDTQDVRQTAGQVNMQYYIAKMGDMLNKIEQKLGVNSNQQPGEQTGQWHDQAVQVLHHALKMAASGGKRQWSAAAQLRDMKRGSL